MVTIRRFESGDTTALLELNRRAMRAVGVDPADVPDIDDLQDIHAAYIDSGGEFLVAERDGTLVGMGGLKVESEGEQTTGELFRMRVHPDYQREGIGRRLLSDLEAAARERGVTRLDAETSDRQTAAKDFYPEHGFEQTGTRTIGEYVIHHYEKEL